MLESKHPNSWLGQLNITFVESPPTPVTQEVLQQQQLQQLQALQQTLHHYNNRY